MSRYAEDLRKIVKSGEIKGALGPKQDREPIEGGITDFITGVFSQGSTGGGSGTGSETNDNTNDSTKQEDIKPIDPANPQTFFRGGGGTSSTTDTVPTTGVQDVESVIDGEAGPQNSYDYNSSVPGSGSSLDGITGLTDCSTGQGINIRYDGNFPPPDGWDDADSPPATDGVWSASNYWQVGEGSLNPPVLVQMPTAESAYADFQSEMNAHPEVTSFQILGIQSKSQTAWYFTCTFAKNGNGQGVVSLTVLIRSCVGTGDPSVSGCVATQPSATEWPTDDSYDLSLIDGSFQANPYDSEAPTDAGGSAVDFCFSAGTRQGRLYATAQGGTMLVETVGGVPNGTAKVYGSDGRFQAAGDATNSFMNQYLPK
jgi:hypothetical protein